MRSSNEEVPISKVTPNATGVNPRTPLSIRPIEETENENSFLRLKISFSTDSKECSFRNVLKIKFEEEYSAPGNSSQTFSSLLTEKKNYDLHPRNSSESSEKYDFLLLPNLELIWQWFLTNTEIPNRKYFTSTYLSENTDIGEKNLTDMKNSLKKDNYKNNILSSNEKLKFLESKNEDEILANEESAREIKFRERIEKQGNTYVYNCYGERKQDNGDDTQALMERPRNDREREDDLKRILSLPSQDLEFSSRSPHHQSEKTDSKSKNQYQRSSINDNKRGKDNVFNNNHQSDGYDIHRKVRTFKRSNNKSPL